MKDDDRWFIDQRVDGTYTLRNLAYNRYLHQDNPKNVNTVFSINDAARWRIRPTRNYPNGQTR